MLEISIIKILNLEEIEKVSFIFSKVGGNVFIEVHEIIQNKEIKMYLFLIK